jgi:hypothetical protein
MSNTNTSPVNWGEMLKVEVGDLTPKAGSGTTGRTPAPIIPAGRHAAFLQEVKHGAFKTGSYGMSFTYVIDTGTAKNSKIKETVVLAKANKDPVQFVAERLKRRLMAFGLTVEKINAFKGPRNEHDLGDFKLVLGAPVTIIVKEDGEYNGRPSRKVAAVYSREVTE